jgi:hypothetical protein
MDRESVEYFRIRERAERAAAEAATSDRAKAAHQKLALEYAARVNDASGAADLDRAARPTLRIADGPA